MTSAATSSSPVPAANSAGNATIAEVIGSKLDTGLGTSLSAHAYRHNAHMHGANQVYPTLADGVLLTSDAAAWTLGPISQVIPAGIVATTFDLHYVNIEDLSANGVYEIVLYQGAALAEVEVGRVRATRSAVQSEVLAVPTQGPIVAAGTRISAAVASSNAAADTVTISVFYHGY